MATFYKPDPNSQQVYDANGTPLSYQQYIAAGGKPDFSNVQNTPWPTAFQSAPAPAPTQQPTQQPQQNQSGLTGVPALDEVYSQLEQYVNNLQAQGKTINPNIEITPATVQQFLDQAKTEINPYYASQIDSMKNELKSSLDTLQRQYDLNKQGQESQFKQDLKNTREQFANQGAAYSGFRGQAEQNLKQNTQRTLEGLGLSAAGSAGGSLYNAAQSLGSRNISDLAGYGNVSVPTVSTAGAGGFGSGTTTSSYTPTSITGNIEYQQNADVRNLQDFLTQQEVAKRSLSFTG